MRPTHFAGRRGDGLGWGPFLRGLEAGDLKSYLLLVGLVAGAVVALWAGAGILKGGRRG